MLRLIRKTIKTGTKFVCSLVLPCPPEHAEYGTVNYLGQRFWNTVYFGLMPPLTHCITAWCFCTTVACQEGRLIWTARSKHLARVLSMPRCSERTKRHSHSLGNSSCMWTHGRKMGELILTNLKHYGDNTHRWLEMREQRPFKVKQGLRTELIWVQTQIMCTPWLFSPHSDGLFLFLVSDQLVISITLSYNNNANDSCKICKWLCRLCSF